jgi:hypothetical protein
MVARKLRQALGTSVRVKSVRGKNKIEIEFKDEEDLQRVYSLLEGNFAVSSRESSNDAFQATPKRLSASLAANEYRTAANRLTAVDTTTLRTRLH